MTGREILANHRTQGPAIVDWEWLEGSIDAVLSVVITERDAARAEAAMLREALDKVVAECGECKGTGIIWLRAETDDGTWCGGRTISCYRCTNMRIVLRSSHSDWLAGKLAEAMVEQDALEVKLATARRDALLEAADRFRPGGAGDMQRGEWWSCDVEQYLRRMADEDAPHV